MRITATAVIFLTTLLMATVSTAEMGSSQATHYRVLPVPRGELQSTQKHTLVGDMVRDKDGKNVGTLENIIVDSGTGKIEVAVIGYRSANGAMALTPVSWTNFHIGDTGEVGGQGGQLATLVHAHNPGDRLLPIPCRSAGADLS